jgi:hypothetical protein
MAVGRDALEGMNEGLRSIGAALKVAGIAFKDAAVLCKNVTTNSARAAYDLAGKYTYPIEQELTKTQPPSFSDVPLPGKVALFLPIILPTVIFSVTVIPLFANSVTSNELMLKSFLNVAFFDTDEDQLKNEPDPRNYLRIFYGIPGSLWGGITGFLAVPFILIGRIITNSVKSFLFPFGSLIDLVVPEIYETKIKMRECSWFSHLLGSLGFLAGAISGMVCLLNVAMFRFLRNTFISGWRYFRNVTNYAFPEDEVWFNVEPDDRTATSIHLGSLGSVIGAFFGLFGAFIANCGFNMVASYKYVINLSLPARMKFKLEDEDRPLSVEAAGFLGWIPGVLAGMISFIAVGIARIIVNTGLGFWSALRAVTNVGLPAEKAYKPLADDFQPDLKFGFLGYVFGAIPGAIAAWIASSAIWFAGTFVGVTNLALHTDDKIKLGNDTRSTLGKGIGILGLTGALFGLVGVVAVAVGRLILNMMSGASIKAFFTLYNHALPTDARHAIPPFEKPWYLGVLGAITGALAGASAAFIVSGLFSFAKAFAAAASYALHTDDEIKFPEDKRSDIGKRLGYVGYFFGALAGVLSMPFIAVGRIISNTCKSFLRFFLMTLNWGIPADSLNEIEKEKRNWASRVFGVFGIITGAITGVLFAVAFSSFLTGANIFCSMTNLVLHREDALPVGEFKRNWGAHILGAPGILGVVAGLVAMCTVALVRWSYHTGCSYLSLAGSLLNCGMRRAFFDGLGGDHRSLAKKAVGFLGYLAAATTITPISLAILVFRQVPSCLSLTLGLVFSPLVALYKAGGSIRRCLNPDTKRFLPGELTITDEASVIQGFKNFYSSLNSWGKLVPGKNIAIEADGSKSRWTFFRKSITFNARSVAERTLDTLLADYRLCAKNDIESFGINFFGGEDFTASLEKVKEYYKNGCCVTKSDIEDLHKEIDKLGDCIKKYFNDRHINQEFEIEDVGPPGALAWGVAFWGGERVNAQIDAEEQPGLEAPLMHVEEDEPGAIPKGTSPLFA